MKYRQFIGSFVRSSSSFNSNEIEIAFYWLDEKQSRDYSARARKNGKNVKERIALVFTFFVIQIYSFMNVICNCAEGKVLNANGLQFLNRKKSPQQQQYMTVFAEKK